MTEVMTYLMTWLKQILDALLQYGGYIGLFIVCMPIFYTVVRALRSIISKSIK